MKKLVYAFAILTAAASTAAVAGELKQEKNGTAPALSAQQMTDSEMDKISAGSIPTYKGQGVDTAFDARGGPVVPAVDNGIKSHAIPNSGICVGLGTTNHPC